MWKWDQGRIEYFQYDVIRAIASFVTENDFKNTPQTQIRFETRLPFSAPATHSPWRNYSRVLKLCLLVSEIDGVARPTDVARIICKSGAVTCDEYLHFLVEATTDPSPALSNWSQLTTNIQIRNPLCFSLKYILAKMATFNEYSTTINEIIGAYKYSGFSGEETDSEFITLLEEKEQYSGIVRSSEIRQARESIKFISQISYLHNSGSEIIVSLSQEDAHYIFHSLNPIGGPREINGNDEIMRLAYFFRDGTTHDFFDYKSTIISDVLESGFREGGKLKKTHTVIERNSKLREFYFDKNPVAKCDACKIDTNKKYPWANRILDIHHILPLASGTRVDLRRGTILEDLVPVCPSCHRAIHRFYDLYLNNSGKEDFTNEREARNVYSEAKQKVVKEAHDV